MVYLVHLIAKPFQILLFAFVVQSLWGWYVVDAFNLDALTMVQAYGIGLLANFVSFHMSLSDVKEALKTSSKEEELSKTLLAIFTGFLYSGFVLLLGWIGSRFV